MFPLTHLYVNQKVMGYMSPALALGSVFPDILTGLGVSWKESHDLKNPDSWPDEIFVGDSLHGTGLPGLDYYTDKKWKGGPGYAFQKARNFSFMMLDLGLPESDLVWRGHNQVEMAVEIKIGEEFRYLFHYLEAAYHDNELINKIDSIIHSEYGISKTCAPLIEHFIELNADQDKLCHQYARRLNEYYSLQVTAADIENIIDSAWSYIEDDYQLFLDECITNLNASLPVSTKPEKK